MVDNNSNIIKPLDSLQNIIGLTPIGRHDHRKSRKDLSRKKPDEDGHEEPGSQQGLNEKSTEDSNSQNTIDYCA